MEQIIIKYISVWGWQILAMLFFGFSLLFFALERTTMTSAFYVGFFLIFIACEYMMLKRKKELKENE